MYFFINGFTGNKLNQPGNRNTNLGTVCEGMVTI